MTGEQRKAIRERLEEIAEANNGRLTPDQVVEDARKKNSPLHDQFEWDVKKAAMSHWLDRAREIIVSVHVVIRTTRTDVRSVAYVRDPSAGSSEQGYVSVNRLRDEKDLARDALLAEFQRAADLLRRARNIALALDLDGDVDRIIDGIVELRNRISFEPPSMQQ